MESPQQTPDPKLVESMHRYLLGDIEINELNELEAQLLASPELRQTFIRATLLDSALQEEAEQIGEEEPARSPSVSWWKPAMAAAAAFVLCALAWWLVDSRKPAAEVVEAVPATEVATLGDDRSCEWGGSRSIKVNSRLPVGPLQLESGVAVIEFDGGARLALQGPASLELIGPKTARLHHGNASVRCEEGLYSFSLLTPHSVVTDVGTEFGVAVTQDGGSEVHVLDGEVEVAEDVAGEHQYNRFLSEGETLVVAPGGEDRELEAPTQDWVRDYTTEADRTAETDPPRLIAYDWFPTKPNQKGQFSQGSGWEGFWWHSSKSAKNRPFYFTRTPNLVPRHGEPRLAMLVGGGVEVRRVLADVIEPNQMQTFYLSFSLYRGAPVGSNVPDTPADATVMLRSLRTPACVIGMSMTAEDRLLAFSPGGKQESERRIDGERAQFVVARIELNPHLGHRISMIAYDQATAIPLEEPEKWDLVTRREPAELTAPLDSIALKVRRAAFKFGEINLGNSWPAVVDPKITTP